MSRHLLSKKEIRKMSEVLTSMNLLCEQTAEIQVEESKSGSQYYLGRTLIGYGDNGFIPTPDFLNLIKPQNKKIVVDAGAVPHLLNGANLFSKGILSMTADIRKGDYVFIADEKGRFLAVGISQVDYMPDIRNRGGEAAKTLRPL